MAGVGPSDRLIARRVVGTSVKKRLHTSWTEMHSIANHEGMCEWGSDKILDYSPTSLILSDVSINSFNTRQPLFIRHVSVYSLWWYSWCTKFSKYHQLLVSGFVHIMAVVITLRRSYSYRIIILFQRQNGRHWYLRAFQSSSCECKESNPLLGQAD